jgi:hypothetical protein
MPNLASKQAGPCMPKPETVSCVADDPLKGSTKEHDKAAATQENLFEQTRTFAPLFVRPCPDPKHARQEKVTAATLT